MSGGPGDGDTHETEAMLDLPIEFGVAREVAAFWSYSASG